MNEKYRNWIILFRQYIKRDWKLLLAWIIGLGGFCGGFAPAFVEIGKGQGLIGMYETMKNPAMISLVGHTPVKKAADYTVGAMYGHTMLLFCGLTAMLIGALFVVSHTRKEEETGLAEFVCSYPVGRHAASFALMAEMLLLHIIMSIVITGMILAFHIESMKGMPTVLFAFSIGMAGCMGCAIAFLVAQMMPTSSGANGLSLAIIGILYVLRAATDIYDSELSMYNPMGWIYLTYPFTKNRWMPLGIMTAVTLAMVVISFVLEGRRDMGVGYLPERALKKRKRKSLMSVPGILLHLNKTAILGWILTYICLSGAYGSIYGEMETFLNGNELIQMMFTVNGISIEESFTAVITVVMTGLAAILPAAIINRLFTEESTGRFQQLISTKVSRIRLYWTMLFIAVAAAVTAVFLSSASLGITALSVMDETKMEMTDFITASMNYVPAVLFTTALTALFLGWMPKWGKAVYVYIGYSFMLNYFKGILDLPGWFEKTAVFSWISRMPIDKFDGTVFGVMFVIDIILMVIGCIGYKRRDFVM